MSRQENHTTPKIVSGILYTQDEATTGNRVGSLAWFAWLEEASTFYFEGRNGTFTARRERRKRGGQYWIAYRRRAGILRRAHLGKAHRLTLDRLEAVAVALSLPIRKERSMPIP